MCGTRSRFRKVPAIDRNAADAATLALASRIEKLGIFGAVSFGFFRTAPNLSKVLLDIGRDWERVFVAPLLMADGIFSRKALPDAVNASGIAGKAELLPPIGCLPDLHRLVVRETKAIAQQRQRPPHVVVVGHGSRSNPTSRESVMAVVALMNEIDLFLSVQPAFLDDEPDINEVVSRLDGQTIIVPYFWSTGLHAGTGLRDAVEGRRGQFHIATTIEALPGVEDVIIAAVKSIEAGRATRDRRNARGMPRHDMQDFS